LRRDLTMGYESRIFIVERDERVYPNNTKWIHAEIIVDIKMCKMEYEFLDLFKKEIDYKLYIDDENFTKEDSYGKVMKYTDIQTVIDFLENCIALGDDYRRLPLLLGLLKGIDESKWNEIQIVHYGY
jgi:hypothetical protein